MSVPRHEYQTVKSTLQKRPRTITFSDYAAKHGIGSGEIDQRYCNAQSSTFARDGFGVPATSRVQSGGALEFHCRSGVLGKVSRARVGRSLRRMQFLSDRGRTTGAGSAKPNHTGLETIFAA